MNIPSSLGYILSVKPIHILRLYFTKIATQKKPCWQRSEANFIWKINPTFFIGRCENVSGFIITAPPRSKRCHRVNLQQQSCSFCLSSPILLNSIQTKLLANQQLLHLTNRCYTPSQCRGAPQSQYGINPALGIISKTLGWWDYTDAAITVITKWPFSSTSPPRQDGTNPPLTNTALSGCLGTKAPDTSQRLPGEDCWQFKDLLNAELDQDAVASLFLADKRASSIYLHSFMKTPTSRHVKWS